MPQGLFSCVDNGVYKISTVEFQLCLERGRRLNGVGERIGVGKE
jgi:hypothetical protein